MKKRPDSTELAFSVWRDALDEEVKIWPRPKFLWWPFMKRSVKFRRCYDSFLPGVSDEAYVALHEAVFAYQAARKRLRGAKRVPQHMEDRFRELVRRLDLLLAAHYELRSFNLEDLGKTAIELKIRAEKTEQQFVTFSSQLENDLKLEIMESARPKVDQVRTSLIVQDRSEWEEDRCYNELHEVYVETITSLSSPTLEE